ncbi:MAG: HD domain-containing protein [Phycisphaerales bacterium]
MKRVPKRKTTRATKLAFGQSSGMAGAAPGALWRNAASFAARKHAGQLRRDGRTPYFAHVVRVAMTASEIFGCHDEEALAAALLHDLIEDTTTDYDDLLERFGRTVADMVAALTKNMSMPEAAREKDYDARIARSDWRVRLIKLADAYDNLLDSVNDPRGEKELSKRIEACRRAIALAKRDSAKHAISRDAIAAVNELLRTNRVGA